MPDISSPAPPAPPTQPPSWPSAGYPDPPQAPPSDMRPATPEVSGPLPESPGAAASHLIAEHGWDAETAVEHRSNLQDAHFYAHGGGGRLDLADPALGHAHRPAATVQSVTDWRAGYLPAIAAGLVLMALGLFMPWFSAVAAFVGQIDIKGLDTDDGKIIGVGVLVLAAVAYGESRTSGMPGRIVLLVGSLILCGFVAIDLVDMTNRMADINDSEFGTARIGYGLYLTGAGAAIATVGAILRLGNRN